MPRFYFDAFDGRSWSADETGTDAESVEDAVNLAQAELRDIVQDELPDGHKLRLMVVVKDETGRMVGEAILDMTAATRD